MTTRKSAKNSRRNDRQRPDDHLRSPTQRSPNFASGVIAEPLLAFGGRHEHVDPKTGLALYGPYSLTGQSRPSLTNIIVGIVGPPAMIADAEQWLTHCRGIMMNDGKQPFLYPHFPGFNSGHPFQCELMFGDTWRESLKPDEIGEALSSVNFYERVKQVVALYVKGVEVLTQRDPIPNVILCCIPQQIIDFCTVQKTRTGVIKPPKLSKSEKRARQMAAVGQLFMFPDLDPTLDIAGVEDARWQHQNLRRGIKAETMQFGIPTQLVWPRTLELTNPKNLPKELRSQDIATRAWNFMVALYYKAGGSPWRLAQVEPGICYVGISFYREILEKNPRMRTSMAQAFTSAGDGYVLRGDSFEWNESRHGSSPHLDRNSAAALLRDVLELYQRQNRGSLPNRIVIHKSSKYWEEELDGFNDACKQVPRKDFITLGRRSIQFYRPGDYPPIRGSFVKFSDTDLLLYTSGYIPFLRSYPGPRVPQPMEIMEHYGDSPWNVILEEILALTKMNWNSAAFAVADPITLAFSRMVGQVLSELPSDRQPNPIYRFYM